MSVRKHKLENDKICENLVPFVEERLDMPQRRYLAIIYCFRGQNIVAG